MRYFIFLIIVVSSISFAEEIPCERTLLHTSVVDVKVYEGHFAYEAQVIIEVPVKNNDWLIEYGYSINDTVYIAGFERALLEEDAIDLATLNARTNMACLDSQELRDYLIVKKEDLDINESFIEKMFFWK